MLCHIVYRLSIYEQLLEQLSVALLSRPTVFSHCYSLLLVYCGQIKWSWWWWWWWWFCISLILAETKVLWLHFCYNVQWVYIRSNLCGVLCSV